MTLSHLINTDLASALDEARAIVGSLSPRERRILLERLAADSPRTLDDLGMEMGVTRERVRQLEAGAKKKLAAWNSAAFFAEVRGGAAIWILHAEDLRASAGAWFLPLDTVEPAITPLHLLRALDAVQATDGVWVSRGARTANAGQTSMWDHLVKLGEGGLRTRPEFTKLLANLGVEGARAEQLLAGNGLMIRHGMVRSASEDMRTFLVNEFRSCNHPVSLDRIAEWVEGRWAASSANNIVQGEHDLFTRCDVNLYGLATWNLRAYRGIREEIEALVRTNGPTPIDDVVATVSSWFDVTPGSVRTYALQRPFEVRNGYVHMERGTARSAHLPPSLADLTQPRQWRRVFITDTGYSFRMPVNKDHLRGSGWPTQIAIAAICGVAEGHVFEMPFSNCPGSLKVTRVASAQPTFGSLKTALEAVSAAIGDTLVLRFDGAEGALRSVSLDVIKAEKLPVDPVQRVLLMCGGGVGFGQPLERVAAALGVTVSSWSELRTIAEARGDSDLVAVLNGVHA